MADSFITELSRTEGVEFSRENTEVLLSGDLIESFLSSVPFAPSSGEMFHPLRITSKEAWQLLKDIPAIEETGIVCRIPEATSLCLKHSDWD